MAFSLGLSFHILLHLLFLFNLLSLPHKPIPFLSIRGLCEKVREEEKERSRRRGKRISTDGRTRLR